jgi:hypothetical protein
MLFGQVYSVAGPEMLSKTTPFNATTPFVILIQAANQPTNHHHDKSVCRDFPQ